MTSSTNSQASAYSQADICAQTDALSRRGLHVFIAALVFAACAGSYLACNTASASLDYSEVSVASADVEEMPAVPTHTLQVPPMADPVQAY